MSEWTPGPWEANRRRNIFAGDTVVAQGVMTNGDGVTAVANAHLIAAAPDLYEALRRLERSGHTQATWEYALKAMAKARGEAQ